ncbi:hypothetical protein CTI12_AA229410 [Artemisia annua]|uniref:NYN domain-containing protein n=1 Tax=Artemisia annua TaxID=35608 RepID=A0A2U1NTH4_ARTAN|nr:hypothetical protein CTI12_AA229410 [Artemisia annua]
MEKNHVIVLEGVKENRIILGWDLENSGIQKIDEFVKYLKDEIAKAFPGVDVDIHAFAVKGIEGKTDGTAGKTDGTASMRKKCDLNESIVCHWLEPGIGNDRADYEMVCQIFLCAMRNRSSPLIIILGGDTDFEIAMKLSQNLITM